MRRPKKQPPKQVGRYDFICEKCERTHTASVYCIAQQAGGHDIRFTCDCGHNFIVPIFPND